MASLGSSQAPSEAGSGGSIKPLRDVEAWREERRASRSGPEVALEALFSHTVPAARAGPDDGIDDALVKGLGGFKPPLPTSTRGWHGPRDVVPGCRWLLQKDAEFKRDLLRNPWCFPVSAMHFAAMVIQHAWSVSWLKHTKPSTAVPVPVATYADIREHAAQQAGRAAAGAGRRLSVGAGGRRGKRRASTVARIAAGLRTRYFNILQREAELVALAARGVGTLPSRSYSTFENFCCALIQGFWRSRRDLRIAKRVAGYRQFKLYQVAAYEIQNAWRRQKNNLAGGGGLTHFAAVAAAARRGSLAVLRIQLAWRGCVNYRAYQTLRDTITGFRGIGDPCLLLRTVLPRESMLLDPAMQVHVRFRLGGSRFPPTIYFKIFTHGKVCDLGAFAPRDYAGERRLGKDRAPGWYERWENNGWRALAARIVPGKERHVDEVEKTTARRVIKGFHFSRLQRRQDVEHTRKLRTIDWMRRLYGMELDTGNAAVMARANEQFAVPSLPAAAPKHAAGSPAGPAGFVRQQAAVAASPRLPLVPRRPAGSPGQRPWRRPPSRASAGSGPEAASPPSGRDGAVAGTPQSPLSALSRQEALYDEMAVEDQELLEWSKGLDFDTYLGTWQNVATSTGSEGTLPIRGRPRECAAAVGPFAAARFY